MKRDHEPDAPDLADARFWKVLPPCAGAAAALLGLMVVTMGWLMHWRAVIQLSPAWAPMKFNTAAAFVLCGLSLVLLSSRQKSLVAWFGAAVAALGAATLLEYLTGTSFGIDELFVRDDIVTATTFPGRMSPLTASCFLFIGGGLALTQATRRPWRLAAAGLLGCVVMVVAFVAIFGYILGIEVAYGWGAYTRMALHTASAFFLLGSGLFVWSWQQARAEEFNFLRWVPIIGSITLMLMIGIVSAVSLLELKDAVTARESVEQDLRLVSSLSINLANVQRGMRGYVLTGDSTALDTYRTGTNAAAGQVAELVKAASELRHQQRRSQHIIRNWDLVLAYSQELLATNATGGITAAIQLEKTGRGLRVMDRALQDLDSFTRDEQAWLTSRDQMVTADFQNTTRLLIFGCILAGGLLVFAHLMAGREVRRRTRAEKKQRVLNAQLEETSALQDAILRSANYAIISTDTEGVVTTFNSTAEKWLGYAAMDLVGRQTPALWHDAGEVAARARALSAELGSAVEPGFEAFVAKARLGLVDENEWTFIRKDGSHFPVLLSVTALKNRAGVITGFLGVIADITERKLAEEKLHASEERFRLIVDSVQDYAIFMLDTAGRVTTWNSGAERIKGYRAEEVIGRHFSIFYPPDALAEKKPEQELAGALARGFVRDEGPRVRKDGSIFYADVLLTALYDEHGRHRGYAKLTRNISESRLAEERLRESEERFRSAFDDAPIGMSLVNPHGRWLKVNHALCEMLGYSEMELLATDFQHITHPDDLATDLGFVQQVLAGEIASYQMEKRYIHKNGSPLSVMLSVSLIRDRQGGPLYFVAQIENIMERKRAAEKIADSLREKEALLREIHHRVKNNMQVISSILQLQTNYIKDAAMLEIFKDCQNRIRTMALIHEKLYRSEGLAQVNIKDYLDSLIGLLLRSQTNRGFVLRHELKIEPAALDVDTAIPLGLIVNELVSNCLKHAFTGRTKGCVVVTFQLQSEHGARYRLTVRDDGNGLPAGFDPEKTGSLGVRLVRILSGQIKAVTEFKNNNGAEVSVTFTPTSFADEK